MAFFRRCLPPVLCLLLAACAPAQNADAPVIALAASPDLYAAAVHALRLHGARLAADGEKSPPLDVRESISETPASIAADGSIGSYRIDYRLFYRFKNGENKSIARGETVDHNENAYRASRERRRQVIDSMRREALRQMINALRL